MNRKGFSLITFLVFIALMGIVLLMGICASRNMLATSLVGFRSVDDSEVFRAAKIYVNDKNITFNDESYVCVSVRNLITEGYLHDTNDHDLKSKMVKLKKDKVTGIIYNIDYSNNCK